MYLLRRPDAMLQDYIEHYWFVVDVAGGSVDVRVEVFVDARADLIFNFGAPYEREVIGGPVQQRAESNFDAQRLVPIRIRQRGRVRVCGVRFRLGGVSPFPGATLADWSGSTPRPEVVFGADAPRLEADLRAERDPDAAAARLDAFFLERLERFGPQTGFERALGLLHDSGGSARLPDVAATAGVSTRHMERLFARRLGLPPKTVARILRFQRALRILMDDPAVALGRLAADVGYFDQPHFIRDFTEFTGGVPRGYRGYYPPDAPTDFAPNVVVFLQDLPVRSIETDQNVNVRGGLNMADHWSGTGTPDDPWRLRTPPLSSEYTVYLDAAGEPGLLVCQVGSTRLTYLARAIDDLRDELVRHGDWMPLGAADEQKEAAPGTVEAWARSAGNPVGGWYGQKKGLRGRFAMYVPPVLEALGLVELEHNRRGNRVRALDGQA
jgi:AraC-like DNA-binding protein